MMYVQKDVALFQKLAQKDFTEKQNLGSAFSQERQTVLSINIPPSPSPSKNKQLTVAEF